MTAKNVKQALLTSIHALNDNKWLFLRDPQKDHTRSRKLPFEKTISAVLTFRGGTLTHDILDFFEWSPSVPTSPAFIQQRAKIIPEAFEYLFHDFTAKTDRCVTYRDLRLLAVDGSDLQCATNLDDPDSFFPGANGQRSYNLLHINAMYDVLQHLYIDAVLQKRRDAVESGALTAMVDRSAINCIYVHTAPPY